MRKQKHIIWSNRDLNFDDWKDAYAEFLEINNLGMDPEDEDCIIEYMYETNDQYLDDERANLKDIQFSRPIIVIADLGLWNGRRSGYKEINSGKIVDCLYSDNDYTAWYVDEHGDFRCDSAHHDGDNHYLYRTYREDVTDEQIEEFKEKIYNGTVNEIDILQVTRRVGDEIAKVYGWEVQRGLTASLLYLDQN